MKLAEHLWFYVLAILLASCDSAPTESTKTQGEKPLQIFELVNLDHHQIIHRNTIKEDLAVNYMTFDGIYLGSGVAIADLNNDGLDDVVFSGNQIGNQIYLNKGNLKFENITSQSGIVDDGSWSMGVAIADVNNDGLRDIYVSEFLWDEPERRTNKLYINKGDMTFKESAADWGVADQGFSIQSAFVDYDKDGDLDLYVVNQPPNSTVSKRALKGKIHYGFTDRFYRNDGNRFTDVTGEAGIKNYAYGLSATVADLNHDGWPDIYVGC